MDAERIPVLLIIATPVHLPAQGARTGRDPGAPVSAPVTWERLSRTHLRIASRTMARTEIGKGLRV